MRWRLEQVATATDGRGTGTAAVTSVEIDSRSVESGAVFVAVRGERDDGHKYLADARSKGAVAVVVEYGRLDGGAGVEVSDTTAALLALAVARRAELSIPVVAVTGSSGKTTTKDFIAAALGSTAHASPRSFNNEFGVPLTVLGTPDDARALVVEIGSRGQGHIARLVPAVRPDVAVITNAGRAHLDLFGSLAAVVDAKWELVDALGERGTAVLPAEDDRLTSRRTRAVLTFGEVVGADVAVADVALEDDGRAACLLNFGGESVNLRIPVPGRHQPRNVAAAVAAAIAVGESFTDAVARIETATISPWRMESVSVAVAGGSFTLVNDAYNANPDSMASALETVAAMPGRRIAVLGKMHELGDFESDTHHQAGALAASLGFHVVVVGEDPGFAAGAGPTAVVVPDVAAAVERLQAIVVAGDVVLLKASRAAGLEAVATALLGVHG